jgi:hypothetical protein
LKIYTLINRVIMKCGWPISRILSKGKNLMDDHSSKVCITTNLTAAYPNLTSKQSRKPFQTFL